MPSVKFPFGAASSVALTATGDQAITIDNMMTIIDGVSVVATGNRTLNLTIDPGIKAGARILIKTKTTGAETTVYGTGMKGATLAGVAGKTFVQEAVYDGTHFFQAGTPKQID